MCPQALAVPPSETSLHLIWQLTFYDSRRLPLWGDAKFSAEEVEPAGQRDEPLAVAASLTVTASVFFLVSAVALTLFTLAAIFIILFFDILLKYKGGKSVPKANNGLAMTNNILQLHFKPRLISVNRPCD